MWTKKVNIKIIETIFSQKFGFLNEKVKKPMEKANLNEILNKTDTAKKRKDIHLENHRKMDF